MLALCIFSGVIGVWVWGGWGKGRTAYFLLVTAQDDPLFHRADVEHAHGLVARGAREEVPVRRPGERLYRILVLVAAGAMSAGR